MTLTSVVPFKQTYSLVQNDNGDNDDNYNQLFLWNGWPTKSIQSFQPVIKCSKLTAATLEQGFEYVQS